MNRLILIRSTTGKRFILDYVAAVRIGLLDAETGQECTVWFTRTLDILPADQQCFCPQPDLGKLSPFDLEHLRVHSDTVKYFFSQFMMRALPASELTPADEQQLTQGTIALIEPVLNAPRQLLIRNGQPVAVKDAQGQYFIPVQTIH